MVSRWRDRRAGRAVLIAGCLLLAGCTASSTQTAPGPTVTVGTITRTLPPTETRTVTSAPASTAPSTQRSTPPSSRPPSRSSESPRSSPAPSPAPTPAPTTPLPEPQVGACPYLPDDELILLTGQRQGPTRIIAAQPAPICVFQRSDEGWMAAIRVFRTPDASGAVAAVDSRIPVADSSPADRPAGWTGGYLSLPEGTAEYPEARSVYGVSKGDLAVVAWTNQLQSVKSRRIVEAVITRLGW